MASNSGSKLDGDGNSPDWIEIYNPDATPADLTGYFLTDDVELPQRWPFPAGTTIAPGGYLLVFASARLTNTYTDAGGFRHTNFSLTENGEFLTLYTPAGVPAFPAFNPAFPAQRTDFSYGESPGGLAYFKQPTPGAANTTPTVSGFVADTRFSHLRGYHTAAFSLTISTLTPGAEIVYTTNGSPPSATNGTLYTAPIPISATSVIRAYARKTGLEPTNVDTQTYLFLSGILQQNNTPPGYPTTWAGKTADYAMDPQVVTNPVYANTFQQAFDALPALCLSFDPAAFFNATTGIYQNPTLEGPAWERPLSAELIVADGSEPGFQIDCGVRVQGGSSRSPDTPKHSLGLRFNKEYGAGKLDYPLFANHPGGKDSLTKFDFLQLRPEYNFGFMHRHWYQCERAQYGRDQWASDLFIKMGRSGMRGRWSHLFLNGIYWGLYDIHERPDSDYASATFGGTPLEYDVINSSEATDGDLVAYNAMMDLAYGTISTAPTYTAIQQYLDVDAFIDYMLLNFYIGNRDWDGHNWRASRRRVAGAPFRFFAWDSEFAITHLPGGSFPSPPDFFTTSLATNVTSANNNRTPSGMHQRLVTNAEYRLRFADRVRRHCFNNGALTATAAADAWRVRSLVMDKAIVAESARWGDFRRDVDPGTWTSAQFRLYTPNDHYKPVQNWLFATYFPQRTAGVLTQLRTATLYPTIAAPDYSQHGGIIPGGFPLTLTGPAGATLFYTLDGSDPRLAGGAVNPASLTYSAAFPITENRLIQARARNGATWSALTSAFFTIDPSALRITEIMYRPPVNPLAEFIEITNTGAGTIPLAGMQFSSGISFSFTDSPITSLAPGARLLIVRDLSAFSAVYGNAQHSRIAGVFADLTALDNSGETLTLTDGSGQTVLTVAYADSFPWPNEADGTGPSLVLKNPATTNPALPENWRASTTAGGNPGTSDGLPLAPGADLLTYYLGTDPNLRFPDANPATVELNLQPGADAATHVLEYSSDLTTWTPFPTAPALTNRSSPISPGPEVLRYTITYPPGTSAAWLRARISLR